MEHVEVQDGTRPLSTFAELSLSERMLKIVSGLGFENPTPIQEQAIPLALTGKDIVGLAQTGTGKTAAFAIPMIERISELSSKYVKALVLAPTRELADQIHATIRDLTKGTKISSMVIFGGVSHQRQLDELRRRPDIVVACPGRLLDHIQGRSIDLSHVEVLVVDEADRMCDMGFLPDVKRIARLIPKERQTLLFSATMPDEVAGVAREMLTNPETVQVAYEKPVALITHGMYRVDEKSKAKFLTDWVGNLSDGRVVVFTQMKHVAKRVAEQLIKNGVSATSLQGNLSQGKRKEAIEGFRRGRYEVLVATDIASRGIDVDGVTHVVNYDMPMTLDAYIHRTGRAGRASRSGDAVSLITRRDRGIQRAVERYLGSPLNLLGEYLSDGQGPVQTGEARQSGATRERVRVPRTPDTDDGSDTVISAESRQERRPRRDARSGAGRSDRSWDRVRKPRTDRVRTERGSDSRSSRGDRFEAGSSGRGERPHSFRRDRDGNRERPSAEMRRGRDNGGRRPQRDGDFRSFQRSDRHEGRPQRFERRGDRSADGVPSSERPSRDRNDSGRGRPQGDRTRSDRPARGDSFRGGRDSFRGNREGSREGRESRGERGTGFRGNSNQGGARGGNRGPRRGNGGDRPWKQQGERTERRSFGSEREL